MNEYFAYIRVSTVKQGEHGSSLQEQRAAIEAYALRSKLTVSEWFEEKETAAKRGRRMFNQMLRLLDKGRAAGVIIHKIDRSARNLRDWADLGELIDRGVQVHFAHESLDLTSRGGRLSADIQAVVAADYIRNLRDEVRKGFVGRLKQGLYPLPAPIGYRNHGKGQPKTPDPIAAPLIRNAFELYASGQYTLESLCEEMHRQGLRNRRGGRVSINGLSTVLNSEFYIGIVRIRRTGEVFQGVHEPIVSKRLFDACQARLSGKARHAGLLHFFRYRRMLPCVHCGRTLVPERQKGHPYYRCHTKGCLTKCVREESLEDQMLALLARLRMSRDELSELAAELHRLVDEAAESHDDLVQGARLSLAATESKLLRLTDAFLDQMLDKQTFDERRSSLLHERSAREEKVRELERGPEVIQQRVADCLELLSTLSDKDGLANPEERHDVLKNATSNRGVSGKTLVVTWLPVYQVLADRQFSPCGEPYRDTPRTEETGRKLMEAIREVCGGEA